MQTLTKTETQRGAGGFTLVELLLAMLISTLIMAAMYCAFQVQQRTQAAQEQVADMELNARVAMSVLAEDFRMAGFDPYEELEKKILAATPGEFRFETYQMSKSGTPFGRHTIAYRIPKKYDGDGPRDDGVVDGWSDWVEDRPSLARVDNGSTQALARGVEAVEFVYLVGDDMEPTLNPDPNKLDDIRAVTVTLLMRSTRGDRSITPRKAEERQPGSVRLHGLRTVDNPSWGALPVNDHHGPIRRRIHYSTVQLRNTNLIKP